MERKSRQALSGVQPSLSSDKTGIAQLPEIVKAPGRAAANVDKITIVSNGKPATLPD